MLLKRDGAGMYGFKLWCWDVRFQTLVLGLWFWVQVNLYSYDYCIEPGWLRVRLGLEL